MTKLLGGARLSPGGLHIGHYIGNLLPYYDFAEPKEYCFIIKDTEPLFWNSNSEKEKVLFDMVSDVLSVPFADSIRISTTSRIHHHAFNLNSFILDEVSFNTLVSTHFKKEEFKSGNASLKLKYFLFPIDEALTLLSLDIDYFLTNDDNKRIVSFSRDVAKKLNGKLNKDVFKKVELRSNKHTPRILGHDYKRMCKANNNIIGINEPEEILLKKLKKVTSKAHFLTEHPNAENDVLSSNYLPFVLMKIFSETDLTDEQMKMYSLNSNAEKLVDDLFSVVNSKFKQTRERKAGLLSDTSALRQRIESDTNYLVEKHISKMIGNLKFHK